MAGSADYRLSVLCYRLTTDGLSGSVRSGKRDVEWRTCWSS